MTLPECPSPQSDTSTPLPLSSLRFAPPPIGSALRLLISTNLFSTYYRLRSSPSIRRRRGESSSTRVKGGTQCNSYLQPISGRSEIAGKATRDKSSFLYFC